MFVVYSSMPKPSHTTMHNSTLEDVNFDWIRRQLPLDVFLQPQSSVFLQAQPLQLYRPGRAVCQNLSHRHCTVGGGDAKQCTTPLGLRYCAGCTSICTGLSAAWRGLPGLLGSREAFLGSGLWGQRGGSLWAMGLWGCKWSDSLSVMERMVLSARPVFRYHVMPLMGES